MGKTVAVVGAGLAGAAAAYRLNQSGWQVSVFESGHCVGGRANTLAKNGYLIDTGASGLASSYTDYMALAREAGVFERILPAKPCVGMLKNGRIYDLDMRRTVRSGLTSPFLSIAGKLKLLKLFGDVFLAKRRNYLNYASLGKAAPLDVETTRAYAERALGQELADYFCDPLVRVMTLANADAISKVEFFSGMANVLLSGSMSSMQGGQQSFAEHLLQGIDIHLRTPVLEVRRQSGGIDVSYRNQGGDGRAQFDACVIACPLPNAVELCSEYDPLLRPLNQTLRYSKAISVSIGASASIPTESFMVLIPEKENATIATLFLEHNKCADRAPPGHSLLTAYLEVSCCEQLWKDSDAELEQRVEDALIGIFPTLGNRIDLRHVQRWNPALPVMSVGNFKAIGDLNERLDPANPIQLAGDYLSGAGQNTAVSFGLKAADNLIREQMT